LTLLIRNATEGCAQGDWWNFIMRKTLLMATGLAWLALTGAGERRDG
jgi:hypothetical protein